DNANPNGSRAGTAFFGGPKSAGSINGLQAERARIPYANVGLVKIPDNVTDEQALMLSDIFPTGYFGADIADIEPGKTVAIFGCGPVGQFAIMSAKMMGARRIIAVDMEKSRLSMARDQGAETIDFQREDPTELILEMTRGIGVDRVIDAVGVDAFYPTEGPAAQKAQQKLELYKEELREIMSGGKIKTEEWHHGTAPSIVSEWAIECVAKAGLISIIGVYPDEVTRYPIGKAMGMNLSIKMGNCPHIRYIPMLMRKVETGAVDPSEVLTQVQPVKSVIEAYKTFDDRKAGWMKVELKPSKQMVGT
ncbi:MAG: zinc-binding dehydrogenase, partial [Vulcanimicrobiota bacterium]